MQFIKLTFKCISYNYRFASNIPSLFLVVVHALDMGEDAGAELVAVGPVVVVVVVAASASDILQGPEIR